MVVATTVTNKTGGDRNKWLSLLKLAKIVDVRVIMTRMINSTPTKDTH
jgi:hypothetical protein